MSKKIFTLIFSCLSLYSFSQVVPVAWTKNYNGPADNDDEAVDMVIDAAGNVYVTGTSFATNGTYDIATVKYNTAGVQQWVATYNGPGNTNDQGAAIAVDVNGNVYVTGSAGSVSNLADMVTIKYNSAGIQQWAKTYNGSGNGIDNGADITVDNAGNVYTVGTITVTNTYTDIMSIKYNAAGTQQWATPYNGTGNLNDVGAAIVYDGIGSVYICGTGNQALPADSSDDFATIKYNAATGAQVWFHSYYADNFSLDNAHDIALDAAGNIIVTGMSGLTGNWFDYATVKYDPTGVQQWVARYNFGPNKYEDPYAVTTDIHNNVYVTGMGVGTGNSSQLSDMVTIKYNAAGTQKWVSRYSSVGNNDDRGFAIGLDDTLNVYVTGYITLSVNDRNFMTLKYDSSGTQKWTVAYDATGGFDEAHALAVGTNSEIYVSGYADMAAGSPVNNDYMTIKYATLNIGFASYNQTVSDIILYPNPSSGNSTVSITSEFLDENSKLFLSVYDLTGKEIISQQEFKSNNKFATFNLAGIDLSKGMYLIKVNDDKQQFNGVGRIVIQ